MNNEFDEFWKIMKSGPWRIGKQGPTQQVTKGMMKYNELFQELRSLKSQIEEKVSSIKSSEDDVDDDEEDDAVDDDDDDESSNVEKNKRKRKKKFAEALERKNPAHILAKAMGNSDKNFAMVARQVCT